MLPPARWKRRIPPSIRVVTKRQQAVLQELAEGKTFKEVAAELFIAESTVETHVRQASERLGTESKVVPTLLEALRRGVIS